MTSSTLSRIGSALLVGLYGGLAGGFLAGLLTFWMWGLGSLVGMPCGFVAGAVLGWQMDLQDALILAAGCFSGMVAVLWLSATLDRRGGPDPMIGLVAVIFASGPLCALARKILSPRARMGLALGLLVSCGVNVFLLSFVHS